jgi:hypothetical protein
VERQLIAFLIKMGFGILRWRCAVDILSVVVGYLIVCVMTFNVDVDVPIVKEGTVSSYFGFSVAQHYVFNRIRGYGDPVIIVGAPRDNVTDLGADSRVRQLVRPGAVYQCPVTSSNDDCSPLLIDREAPSGDVDKNDQWLGVAVASQGTDTGRAVACAHRYKKAGAAYVYGLGSCVSMSNTLDEEVAWEPCDGKPKAKGHEQYGFCQVGTSVAVDKEGNMVLGAPGPYAWRGAVFKNVIQLSLSEEPRWFQSPVEDPLPGRAPGPNPATSFYSYLGMSVKIGNVLNGKKTYVVGAPRSKDVGQVLLMQEGSSDLEVRQYLTGEQFGSSFGYDIALVDLNGDSKEDVFIGAPFYHKAGVGGAIYIFINGPQGISSDRNQTIYSRKMKELECTELDCLNARFGFALANAYDIDGDGYNDVAVGAPYEGHGAIYIFRGSHRGLVEEFSQRIYATSLPSSVQPLRTFGHVLSAGMDMDINGYPDLVVGAFASDKIVVLRSRPVINVVSTMTSTPERIDPSLPRSALCRDRVNTTCFELKLCFVFTAKPLEKFPGPIHIVYKVEAEKFAGTKVSRVSFKGARTAEEGHVLEMSQTLLRQSTQYCSKHIVYINSNNRDFLNPIKFRLTQHLKDEPRLIMSPGQPLPDINRNPVLNATLVENHLSVDFVKNCGRDLECVSSLSVQGSLELPKDNVSTDYILRVGQVRDFRLDISVINSGEEAHEATVVIQMPADFEYLGTDERGKQYSCSLAESNTVLCAVGNPLTAESFVQFAIRIDPSKVTATGERLNITLNVNTTSKESNPIDDITVIKMKAIIETDIVVKGISIPEQVMFSGQIVGASAIRSEEEIGTEIVHRYEVENSKSGGRVAWSTLHISWPYEAADGKYLLYLMDQPLVHGPVRCEVDSNMINPMLYERRPSNFSTAFVTSAELKQSRRSLLDREMEIDDGSAAVSSRRDVDQLIRRSKRDSVLLSGRHHAIVKFDCEDRSKVKCYDFVCHIGELSAGEYVVVQLRARLWNSTFLEDYVDVDRVLVSSRAKISIDAGLHVHQPLTFNDHAKAETTVVPDIQVQRPLGISLWIIIVIIIVAIIIGIFLLCLIMLLLWKCGFFKRYKPTDEHALHKAKMEKQELDFD